MQYTVGKEVEPRDLDDDLEIKELGEFSIAYKPDSVDVKETDNCFYLLQGLISNKKSLKQDSRYEDAEVVSKVWEGKSQDNLEELEGFYTALIIEDGVLKVFRDIFGSKPVYYTEDNDSILLSSSIRPLLNLRPELDEVNREVAGEYLENGLVDHRRETFFEGVRRLRPKENLLFDDNVEIEKSKGKLQTPSKSLKESLQDSIDNLRPSENFFCPVSGGLDSTVIASECRDADQVHVRFTNGTADEKYIGAVEEEYGQDADKLDVKPLDLLNSVDESISFQEEPGAFPAVEGQSLLYRHLDEDSVVFTGTGADELFYGYPWFLPFYLAQQAREKGFLKCLKSIFSYRKTLRLRHLSKALKIIFTGGAELVNLESGGLIKGEYSREKISSIEEAREHHLENFYFPHMLRITEKQAQHYNLDVRHPFLSEELLAISQEKSYKENFQKGLNKFPVRSEFKEDIPEKIYGRKQKTGFVWMRNDLYTPSVRREFLEVFKSDSFQARELISSRKVVRLLQKDKLYYGTAFRLYSYEKWLREFID